MEHNEDYPGENTYRADFESILERFRELHLDMGNKENRSAKGRASREVPPKSPSSAGSERPLPAQQQSTLNQLRPSPVPSGDINGDKREPSTPVHETNNGRPSETNPNAAGRGNATRNRVLGDYTLSKTLGAGSMGKVKLAHHNVTGEKVFHSV